MEKNIFSKEEIQKSLEKVEKNVCGYPAEAILILAKAIIYFADKFENKKSQ
jgi:hypothetical protein